MVGHLNHDDGETCDKKDDCNGTIHVRTHERDPQLNTLPHDDAPTAEAVCPIHGVIEKAQ